MDIFGFWAFVAGLGVGWRFWRLNDNIPGFIIYQLYYGYVGKLDKLLVLLDKDYVYDAYIEIYKSKLSYRSYCKAVENYVPIARKRQNTIILKFIYYETVKLVNLTLVLFSMLFFMFDLHWLLFGFLSFFTLRYIYHYIEIVRPKEPYALISYLAADAVSYSRQKKPKKSA